MDSEGPGGPADPSSAPQPSASVPDADEAAAAAEKKKKKKKAKVRSAWISFAGRIVAQIVGAAATIVLGIYLVTNHRASSDGEAAPRAARTARAASAEPSLAVLPFDNYSGDASQDYFVNGMTEAIIADLARVRGLRVISRTSSMHYQGQKKALPEIASELGVDLLVEGSVAREGNRVRITAQLIDGASDEHIWARSYRGKGRGPVRAPVAHRHGDRRRGPRRGVVERRGRAARCRSRGLRPLPARTECLEYPKPGRVRAGEDLLPAGDRQGPVLRAGARRPCRHLPGRGPAERHSGRPRARREAAERALALDDSLGEAHASSPARCTARSPTSRAPRPSSSAPSS